ncbi:MAG: glycosyltransferase family 1 protein [Lachnospiraceae bacterium]|nr:glycosyltransferase family 1 protein [Lachnospiraceae bacterium]
MPTINYVELHYPEYENSIIKNKYIANTVDDYIAFLNSEVTNSTEVQEVLNTYKLLDSYDVVLFGENVPDGEADLLSLLLAFDMNIYGFVYKKSLTANAGCFNTKLTSGTNYEFICRLAMESNVLCIPCSLAEGTSYSFTLYDYLSTKTLAYMSRKYLPLFDQPTSNDLMTYIINKMCTLNLGADFTDNLNLFLQSNVEFEQINENTSPFFVIMGDELCHGVLRHFAHSFAKALISAGQAVITSHEGDEQYGSLEKIEKIQLKGIIGFQAASLQKDYFRKYKCKKYQFALDNPMLFPQLFKDTDENYHFLCQDANYAKDLKKYYNIQNATHLPPAGELVQIYDNSISGDRPYDIIFIGAYIMLKPCIFENPIQTDYFNYMISNPDLTFTEGLQKLLAERGQTLENAEFQTLLTSMLDVCESVCAYYRKKIIDTLLGAGYSIHVYGDTWNEYPVPQTGNLIIHPYISAEESDKEFQKAKIGLNIMRWHKDGMTERVANIMLAGCVCLSDETKYLCENFTDGTDIVLFNLKKSEDIPSKLEHLLNNNDYRLSIAQAGYEKALNEHTWKNRVEKFLEITG